MHKLAALLIVIGLTSVLAVSPYLGHLYATTRPTAADPAAGRVYEHNVRGGHTVFLTQGEHWAVFGSFAGGALLGILGGALFVRGNRGASGAA